MSPLHCTAGWVLALVGIVATLSGEALNVSPRPGSEAGGLNIAHPALPGNVFDFRTCEGVLDGNRDFGLFRVKLGMPGTNPPPAWATNRHGFHYQWTYPEGISVRLEAIPRAECVEVLYTVVNGTPAPLQRVHLHTCVTTTGAPAFFPPLTTGHASQLPVGTRDQDYTELLDRLHLWSEGRAFALSGTRLGRTQVHLSLMPRSESPIEWGWWVNVTNTFDEPLVALASRDGQWTAGLWMERPAWASANTGDDRACFHLFPLFGRIEPGASATVRGAFWLIRGTPEDWRQRVRR